MLTHVRFVVLLCLGALAAPAAASTGSWPGLLGPEPDLAQDIFDADGFGLEVSFKIPLGSAYSRIAIVDGKAITMYSEGTSDVMVALEAATGRELWRYRIDDIYKGHDGSDDGPLSSPVIDDGIVYGVAPRGKLFALRLADGSEVWSRSIEDELGGKAPEYGFATTPVIEGNMLVVQTGGEDGHSLTALEKRTGKVLWSRGDDKARYQSPTVMDLADRRQLVVATENSLYGLVPTTGEVLWNHEHPEGLSASRATATSLGDDRLLVNYSEGLVAYDLSSQEEGFRLEKLWESRELRGGYSTPALHEGHLYGFTGEFLTCLTADTGERVWKSRPPGGRGLILVDDHLVVLAKGGVVVVASATPEGYRERARIETFGRSSYTRPSFADGRFYVRNLEELAVISITDAPPARPEERPRTLAAAGRFGEWVKSVEASPDRKARIAEFLALQKSFPLVEDDRWVHFVYQGEIKDIAITGSMVEYGATEALVRIEGTDFYYRSYEIVPGVRWDYRFQVDFDEMILDPRNDRVSPHPWEDKGYSVAMTSDYPLPEFLQEPPGGHRGRLESFEFESDLNGSKRNVTVYLPAGYDDTKARYPVVFFTDGKGWIDKGKAPVALDNLIGERVRPVIAVFVDRRDGPWWLEEGGSQTGGYARMLAEELVPQINARYRTRKGSDHRAVVGADGAGFAAAYGALRYPDVFGKAAVQSIRLDGEVGDELLGMLSAKERAGVDFYVDWNLYEIHSTDRGFDYAEYSRTFVAALEDHGYEFAGGEALDSYGWGSWRSRTDDILVAFFPLE